MWANNYAHGPITRTAENYYDLWGYVTYTHNNYGVVSTFLYINIFKQCTLSDKRIPMYSLIRQALQPKP